MYSDFYVPTETVSAGSIDSTWLIISAVLAVIGGIAVYALFVSKKDTKEYTGTLLWLHEFLNFKKFFIEVILKVLYVITAIYITLSSFSYIGNSVATFFSVLIFGNIIARIGYELILMLITLVNNTTEINNKMGVVTKKEKMNKKETKDENKNIEN